MSPPHRVGTVALAVSLALASRISGEERKMRDAALDLSAWHHRIEARIDHTKATTTLADYQVKLVLSASSFDFSKAQRDGRDLRLVNSDGQTLLDYWVECYEPSAQRAVIWVKVPEITAGQVKTIYLLHGNPNAEPASNGGRTFEFFDDCENGRAEDRWEVAMGEPVFEYLRYSEAFQKPGGIWHASGAKERVSPTANTVYGGAHATYCAWTRPMAVYAPAVDKTFFVFGNMDNSPTISFYDHQAKQLAPAQVLGANPDMDAHKNPHLLIDEGGYLYVFYRSHCSPTHLTRSAKPYDISEWENLGAIVERSSYPQPWQVKPGEMIVLYRGGGTHDATESIIRSTDRGQTWSRPEVVVATPRGNGCYGVSIAETGDFPRRVHFAWSVTRGKWWQRYHVYYAYSDDGGATWRKTDGRAYELPITEETSEMIFESDVPDRGVWLKDIQLDSQGNPYVLFIDSHTPTYDGVWRMAKCVDDKWTFHELAASDHMYDAGAIVFLADDDIRIYAPTTPSQPYQDGGEIEEWQSTDAGVTWTNTKHLTSGSKYSHNHVKAVHNAGRPDFRVFWNYGDARNPPETHDVDLYWYGEGLASPQKMDLCYDADRPGRLLRVDQPEKIDSAIRVKGLNLSNVALDADVRTGPPQMRHAMLCLHVGDGPRMCGTALPYRRGTIYRKLGARWHRFDRGTARISAPAVWHRWSFQSCAGKLKLLVDDEPIVEAHDDETPSGSVGARVWHTSMCLDNIRVRKLAEPEPVVTVGAGD